MAASPRGTWLDLRTGDADRDDPARGQSWGRSRTLRAEAITALTLGDFDPVPGARILTGRRHERSPLRAWLIFDAAQLGLVDEGLG